MDLAMLRVASILVALKNRPQQSVNERQDLPLL